MLQAAVPPRDVGENEYISPQSPMVRRSTTRTVIPILDEVREIEVFDAHPSTNQRQEVVTNGNSSLRFLTFARTLLEASLSDYAPMDLQLDADQEAILYVNRGEATVRVGLTLYALTARDVLYLPIGSAAEIATGAIADLSEFRARNCSTLYPVQLVRHAEIEGTPLAATLGRRPSTRRTVYKCVDQNVQACRLLFGDTYLAARGGVGSYPPHFHGPDGPKGLGSEAKEEIYHFRMSSDIAGDRPFVLQNAGRPGEPVGSYFAVLHEQAVNVTPGYHDTIAPPAVDFMFTWCLASFTENQRDWGRIHNREGYENEW